MNTTTMTTYEIEMRARALRAAFIRDGVANLIARLRGTRAPTTDTGAATV